MYSKLKGTKDGQPAGHFSNRSHYVLSQKSSHLPGPSLRGRFMGQSVPAKDIGEGVPWVNALNQICEFVGKLFLNGLKMVVIPLVLTSVICGVSQISSDRDFGTTGNENLD